MRLLGTSGKDGFDPQRCRAARAAGQGNSLPPESLAGPHVLVPQYPIRPLRLNFYDNRQLPGVGNRGRHGLLGPVTNDIGGGAPTVPYSAGCEVGSAPLAVPHVRVDARAVLAA